MLFTAVMLWLATLALAGGLAIVLSSSSVLATPVVNKSKFITLSVLAFGVIVSLALYSSIPFLLFGCLLSLLLICSISLPPFELPQRKASLKLGGLWGGIVLYAGGVALVVWSWGPYGVGLFLPVVLFGVVGILFCVAVAGGIIRDYLIAAIMVPVFSLGWVFLVWEAVQLLVLQR